MGVERAAFPIGYQHKDIYHSFFMLQLAKDSISAPSPHPHTHAHTLSLSLTHSLTHTRMVVASGSSITLVVERVDGLQLTADVTVSTSPGSGETVPPVVVEDLSFAVATPSVHFTDTTEVLSFVASEVPAVQLKETSGAIHVNCAQLGYGCRVPPIFFVNLRPSPPVSEDRHN